MAKKKGKNLQKLLKKRQLQQLQESPAVQSVQLPEVKKVEKPQIEAAPELPALPSGEGMPIIKTLISTAIIAAILITVSVVPASRTNLAKFGDWLYQSLELKK